MLCSPWAKKNLACALATTFVFNGPNLKTINDLAMSGTAWEVLRVLLAFVVLYSSLYGLAAAFAR